MNVAVKNDADGHEDARRYVDKIVTERLQTVKGVGVSSLRFRDREIRIWINTDPGSHDLTTKEIKSRSTPKMLNFCRQDRDRYQRIRDQA